MALHKLKEGQSLRFSPSRIVHRSGNQSCKFVNLLPVEDGECQYRIKCTFDDIERIAKESQLLRQQ